MDFFERKVKEIFAHAGVQVNGPAAHDIRSTIRSSIADSSLTVAWVWANPTWMAGGIVNVSTK